MLNDSSKLLLDYLVSIYPELQDSLIQNGGSENYKDSPDYLNLLNKTKIFEVLGDDTQFPINTIKSFEYTDIIDEILSYLVEHNSKNVLRNGYYNTSGSTHSNNVNFQVNHLKSKNWSTLYTRIGRYRFVKLVTETRCFIQTPNHDYVQLFGTTAFRLKSKIITLNKSRMLYKLKRFNSNALCLLPRQSSTIINSIFTNGDIVLQAKHSKKYKKLRLLLNLSIKKEDSLRYWSIFKQLTPEQQIVPDKNYFDYSCPFHIVIKFVLVIIGKVFPLSVWGSQSNKSIIIQRVIYFIKSARHEPITVQSIISSMKITDIRWLGKSEKITSKQDHNMRISILCDFLRWFFEIFLCKLVSSFWHVTETTNYTEKAVSGLLYFNHSTWNDLTKNWLKTYIKDNLVQTTNNRDYPEIAKFEQFNYGELRLIPKKNDFRVLCVPIKRPFLQNEDEKLTHQAIESQRMKYQWHRFSIVLPVLQLISDKNRQLVKARSVSHGRFYSILDISVAIGKYKHQLQTKNNGILPKLYMVKFDMKHCYDQLNQAKIIECFESLFKEKEGDETSYYIRKIEECRDFTLLNRKLRALIKDDSNVEEFDILKAYESKTNNNILIDRNTTQKLTKSQLLDIIKGQVLHSTIRVGNKLFKRNRGVFQGFPLLATFCDMVYNNLVDENFEYLLHSPIDSLLIRLVDDFIFMSTDKQQCKDVYNLFSSDRIQDYGAFINSEKTSWINFQDDIGICEEVKFVGLVIDSAKLEITKGIEDVAPISLASKHSFKAAFKSLEVSFSSRLKPTLLDLTLVSIQSLLFNFDAILGSVLDAFYKHFNQLEGEDCFEPYLLILFLVKLLQFALKNYLQINNDSYNIHLIISQFKKCIHSHFIKSPLKFKVIIDQLDSFI